jgi:hypothetical protein
MFSKKPYRFVLQSVIILSKLFGQEEFMKRDLNGTSKQELLELIEALLDGIDGIESEMGAAEVNQYWNLEKINRARLLVYEVETV